MAFDLERMKKALDGPVITVPKGMTHEQRRAYVKAKLAELDK